MASIDTVDSIEIRADARRIFDTILDYPHIHTWFSQYRCRLLDEGASSVREGSRVAHAVGRPAMTHFVRTVRRIVPGERIEETYDEGDLHGTGTWTFEQNGPMTKVSFFCAVEARSLATKLGFALSGAWSHNLVYKLLLRALKKRCETA